MWRRIEDATGASNHRSVTIDIEGRRVQVREGTMLALALLEAGIEVFRDTPASGAPRAPLCLMGVCFDCLVQVDGRANVQACMTPVRDGMRVLLQHGARAMESGT